MLKVARIHSQFSPMGFTVTYYRGMGFEERVCKRSERAADRDYGHGSPAYGVSADSYSARWNGWLQITEDAEYMFFMQSIGSSRLWIDDVMIVDRWNDWDWNPGSHARRYLSKGVHQVTIEHRKKDGQGALRLRWTGGGVKANTVMGAPHVRKKRRDG